MQEVRLTPEGGQWKATDGTHTGIANNAIDAMRAYQDAVAEGDKTNEDRSKKIAYILANSEHDMERLAGILLTYFSEEELDQIENDLKEYMS